MRAMGILGSDKSAAALVKRVRSWAYKSQRADVHSEERQAQGFALRGIQALGANGSETALVHLDDLARSASSGWTRREATKALEGVRVHRALPRSHFEEELLPDFDLDARGEMRLVFGERAVVLRFDEHLNPRLSGGEGEVLRSFPRLRKTDDSALHSDAKRRVADVRAGVKALAKRTLRRLEQAMVEEHRWKSERWQAQLASHALLQHVARALVWGAYDADGKLTSTFRLTADGSLGDRSDESMTLSSQATIGLVHPMNIPEQVAIWGELFSDYELFQPFEQLQRAVFSCPAEQSEETEIRAVESEVPSGRLFGIRHRGWSARPGYVLDGGSPASTGEWNVPPRLFERTLPDGYDAWIEIDPPLASTKKTPTVTIIKVQTGVRLGALSAISYSELARDLVYLTGSPPL